MASPEISGGSPEKKGLGSKELKKISPETKRLSPEEKEILDKDLAERGEKAEKVIERHRQEKEPIIKSEESHHEKSQTKGESASQKTHHRPKPKTDKEREKVYENELSEIQSKMPAAQRTFSKLIHSRVIENVSETTQKTIFRPSALIGGAVSGLVLGILVYVVARIYGYSLGNLEILSLAFLGAILGLIIEFIVRKIKHKK